jgi:hypothetical protein
MRDRRLGGKTHATGAQGQLGAATAAEQKLLDARSSGPKPARRVLVYGDTYIVFLPDYYLGIVYLNTGRPREAAAAFDVIRSQQLIGPKDREYAQFQKQVQQASAEAAAETNDGRQRLQSRRRCLLARPAFTPARVQPGACSSPTEAKNEYTHTGVPLSTGPRAEPRQRERK